MRHLELKRFWLLAAIPVALGCSGDDEHAHDAGGGSDAAPIADSGPMPDAAMLVDGFDDPSDFDPLGCEPGTMAGLDPTGVWHHDLTIPEWGSFPALTRYDAASPGWTAYVNLGVSSGRVTDDVRLTDDHLFTRVAWVSDSGNARVRALYACRRNADGTLFGKFAYCQEEWGGCFEGEFVSGKVERLPGEAEAEGLTLVSEWGGDPAAPWGEAISVNVRVKDGIAYLARYQDGLRIIDVSEPASPADLGWLGTGLPENFEIYNDVKIVEGAGGTIYALMASSDRGVVTIDVTDPMNPVEKNTFPPIPEGEDNLNVHTLFTETIGGQTRVTFTNLYTIGVDVWDVTDPLNPTPLGSYVHPDALTDNGAYTHDLYVENHVVYINYWTLGLVVVDMSDPSAPVLLGQFKDYERRTNHSCWVTTAGGRKVAVVGDEDFGAHVRVVDVEAGSSEYMTAIGELQLRPQVSVHNIMAFGEKAYIAWYQDGIRILDLSDPTAPTVAAYYNSWNESPGESFYEGAIGLDVDLATGLIYVADTARGLLVLHEP